MLGTSSQLVADLIQNVGLAAVLVLYFVWHTGVRERALVDAINELQRLRREDELWIRETFSRTLAENTKALREMALAISHCPLPACAQSKPTPMGPGS